MKIIGNEQSGMAVGGITVEALSIEIVDNVVLDNSFRGPEQGYREDVLTCAKGSLDGRRRRSRSQR
ncbi:MAG: hypothetical protein R2761_01320 [Acidimicrobiales bacterium]